MEYALKVNTSEVFNGLNTGYEEKGRLKSDSKIFVLINSVYYGEVRWGN